MTRDAIRRIVLETLVDVFGPQFNTPWDQVREKVRVELDVVKARIAQSKQPHFDRYDKLTGKKP